MPDSRPDAAVGRLDPGSRSSACTHLFKPFIEVLQLVQICIAAGEYFAVLCCLFVTSPVYKGLKSPTDGVTLLHSSTGGGNMLRYEAMRQLKRRRLLASKHGYKQCWIQNMALRMFNEE